MKGRTKINGITVRNGIPHVWSVPCSRDQNYKYSLAEYLGLSYWLCPHCDSHLSQKDEQIFCINGCHLNKTEINK